VIEIKKIKKNLDQLYDYGEIPSLPDLSYLQNLNFLCEKYNRWLITAKWIDLTGKLDRDTFISVLLCYYPLVLDVLLYKTWQDACDIGKKGDSETLFQYVDSVPRFAQRILQLKLQRPQETAEIKQYISQLFGGWPGYQSIIRMFKDMQKAENIEDIPTTVMGKYPDEMWTPGRKISSQVFLESLEKKNTFTLTPYNFIDSKVESTDISEIISHPWKTFVLRLGLVITGYRYEGLEGLSIKPVNEKDPYSRQELQFYIYACSGREVFYGTLNDFAKEYCKKNKFLLFPNQPPDISAVLFDLFEENKFTFKGIEYMVEDTFHERIYQGEFIFHTKTKTLRKTLKSFIEELRQSL
jgi:hypothetical protein